MSEPIRCPTCRSSVVSQLHTFPFCSPRCRDVDLGNWLLERYRIPLSPTLDDEVGGEAIPESEGRADSTD